MSYIMAKRCINKQAFKQRLMIKYGEGILKDFSDLFTRQCWNLADVARKHGFTRERARQMFRNLYGHGYQQIRVKKTIWRNNK